MELQLCHQERTLAIAVHCLEPCAQRRGQPVPVAGLTIRPSSARIALTCTSRNSSEEDLLFALETGIDCAFRAAGLRQSAEVDRRAAVSVARKDPLGGGKQPLPGQRPLLGAVKRTGGTGPSRGFAAQGRSEPSCAHLTFKYQVSDLSDGVDSYSTRRRVAGLDTPRQLVRREAQSWELTV